MRVVRQFQADPARRCPPDRRGGARLLFAVAGLVAALSAPSRVRAATPTDGTLPPYEPRSVAVPPAAGYVLRDGSVQIVSFAGMAGAVDALDDLFEKTHAGFHFTSRKGSNYSAASSLLFDASPFAPMGAEVTLGELTGFAKLLGTEPLAIRVAHASLRPGADVSPLAVIVNPGNHLATLTMGQVSRIFSTGASKGDFTGWSQVGVKGDLGTREIHPCGPPESDDSPSDDPDAGGFIIQHVFEGNHFCHSYQVFPRCADVVRRVSGDPQAIGLIPLNTVSADVRVVAIAGDAWSPAAQGTAEEIAAGFYPLDRYLYIYLRRVAGRPIDPVAREYLRMVLSREGQAAIAGDVKGYLPLNPREVFEELGKLR